MKKFYESLNEHAVKIIDFKNLNNAIMKMHNGNNGNHGNHKNANMY